MMASLPHSALKLLLVVFLCTRVAVPVTAEEPHNGIRLLYFSSFPEIVQPEDNAGLAELATAIAEQKRAHPETYFIDGGASLGPSVLGALDRGAHMVDILNAIGPEFMAIGKKEFSYGYDELIVNALASAFPFVTSNLIDRETGRQIDGTDRYFLLEGANLKVGFIALTSHNAIFEYGANQAHPRDTSETVSDLSKELRELGADAVFLMADTDYDDLSEYRAAGLVDGIFYTHNFGNPHSLDHQGVMHTEGALDGKILVLDLWHSSEGKLQSQASMLDISTFSPDPSVANLITSYQTRLSERLSPPIAKVITSFDTLRTSVRSRENAFGNFIADALRDQLAAEAVLINSGAIRGNRKYASGTEISRGNIQRELPFGNRTTLLNIKGATLQKALEHGLECARRADGCALQVSNLRIIFDSSRPKDQRIQKIAIAGKPLEAEKYYLVGVSDFMAAGNDGYGMLKNVERVSNRSTNRAMWDLVAEYAEKLGQIAPTVEGRMIDNTAPRPE
ncbi:bifunctional metallophosphatase/5'-nucleotidase [Kordiimonas aestuarii]|uniref:bifunctional metallophosphatase/5'-nucleotidase n=1 Tax=Kordiimonas aestuarii TaxID=1005925 RepID=UPI0021D1BC9A|nr:5'-nucleotidase C-terminal domain-containing protein [Kordiimonas aestuarii]